MKNIKGKTYIELFLDYLNNFLTVERFAEHYGCTISQGNTIINIGRMQHNKNVSVEGFITDNL